MTAKRVPVVFKSLFSAVEKKTHVRHLIPKRTFSLTSSCSTDNGLSYIHHVGKQPLMYKTIGKCLEEAANKWPDRPWIVSCHEETTLTFGQVLEEADKLAAGLIECGFQKGDRLGIASPNYTKWVVSTMAAARAGVVLVAINPLYTESELEFSLKKVGAKGLIIPKQYKTHNYYNMMMNIAPELENCKPGNLQSAKLPDLKLLIVLDNEKLPGTLSYNELKSIATPTTIQKVAEMQNIIQPDDGCNIQFTSGTTGKPKGAYLSHYNFVNNGYLIGKRNELSARQHKFCVQVPLFHAYGLVIVVMASLQYGSTIVLPAPLYSPSESIKSIIKHKCTMITGTPTMYVDLINKSRESGAVFRSPEIAMIGGALCSPMLFEQIKKNLNVSKIKSLFGMTETSAVVFQSLQYETIQQITETVGHVQEHTEAQVVDAEGKVVPFGTPGELWIRGYCNMLGYWEDPEKTREMITPDKWLKTGDQFILQKDGYGKIVGRLKDIIIRGGENVFPKEIENFLNEHPDVIESHVFGVEDQRLGEEICVGIRIAEGSNFNHEKMKAYCDGKISNFKIPRSTETSNSYYHSVGKYPLVLSTIGQCLEKAVNTWPHKKMVISEYENQSLTAEETMIEVDKMASGLLRCGLNPGDRLGICSPNSYRAYITTLAAARIGVIVVGINPANQLNELKYCLNKVGIKTLVIPSNTNNHDHYGILRMMMPELNNSNPGELNSSTVPSLKTIIMIDNKKQNGVFTYDEVSTMGNGNEISGLQSTISPYSAFSILFTSGTTGLPKAVMQSHFSYMNNSFNVGDRIELNKKYHNICTQLPFFHAFGLLLALASIQHGSSLVIPSSIYDPERAIQSIKKHRCSIISGTPTMYVDILKKQSEKGIQFDSLNIGVTGGALMSPQLFSDVRKNFGLSSIKSVYGMTEVCSAVQSMPDEDINYAIETAGKIMDHTEAKILDENGNVVPMGTPGELYVRSYANMMGYWGDENKTSEVLSSDNWLRTGDQFILEESGYGIISGRLKDIIIRGGENILPKEIEDFLNTHPDIIETHVFGVKDDRLGEEICASVRIKEGSIFDNQKLKKYCDGAIAHFKIPKYLKIVDNFPKTTSGKIQKFKLKEMVENGSL